MKKDTPNKDRQGPNPASSDKQVLRNARLRSYVAIYPSMSDNPTETQQMWRQSVRFEALAWLSNQAQKDQELDQFMEELAKSIERTMLIFDLLHILIDQKYIRIE